MEPAASDDVEEREGASIIGLIALKLGIIKQKKSGNNKHQHELRLDLRLILIHKQVEIPFGNQLLGWKIGNSSILFDDLLISIQP
jgi:hypothetical protein